jgi:hypothetical protein
MRLLRLIVMTSAALAIAFATPAAAAPTALSDTQLTAAALVPGAAPLNGWTAAPAGVLESEPHTQANDIAGGWCGGATDGFAAGELRAAGGASATLQKVVSPDEPNWFVWETLHSFQAAFGHSAVAEAKSFMHTMKVAVKDCASWQTSGGEITNSVSGALVPFSKVGNQRFAVKITTAGDGVTEQTNAVYVRAANNVVVVHTRILPVDLALLKKIVKKAVKKVQQAAAAA